MAKLPVFPSSTLFPGGSGGGGGGLVAANNLSDLINAATARTNLGLGTLATQSGTFSGTSSGTNTGDQTITLTGDVTGSGTGSFATVLGAAITGISGGRTYTGSTLTGENMTLRPNTADLLSGDIRFFDSTLGTKTAFMRNSNGVGNMVQFVMGRTNPTLTTIAIEVFQAFNADFFGLYCQNNIAQPSAAAVIAVTNGSQTATMRMHGTAFTTAGNIVAGTLMFNIQSGTGNMIYRIEQNTGYHVFETTTSKTERLRIANDGSITWPVGGKLGAFGATAVSQQTVGANVNNVAASGTTGQFDDFTSGTVYATDYAALHATIYQLTRSVAQLTVAMRNLGFGT